MAIMDASVVETASGAQGVHPFSPPAGWEGDAGDYLALMRRRFADMNFKQEIMFVAYFRKRGYNIEIKGPFASQASDILDAVCR